MRIGIVGSGVAGLVCAQLLGPIHDVTVLETDGHLGGHAQTVAVELPDGPVQVDVGFIVCNDRTYPNFLGLLSTLAVATRPSEMSFSVRDERSGLEWCGTSAATMFAQPGNALRRDFLRMLRDVVRFNRLARRLACDPAAPDHTLRELLSTGRWSEGFIDWYLVPMGSAIWSADPSGFLDMPARTFSTFFDNHGLLRLGGQPAWRTVAGGSRAYVDAVVARSGARFVRDCPVEKVVRRGAEVDVRTEAGDLLSFDQLIVATHSDQALSLLADPTPAEREVLGAIRYQPNRATLHTDERLLPAARRARASWNYHRLAPGTGQVAVTYDLTRLQGLVAAPRVLLTLNRDGAIDPQRALRRFTFAHPVLDGPAVAAQRRRAEVSGRERTWFVGAYWGYGFHEDGVVSALPVCRALGAEVPW
jgi:predicted NAD/FAD-binding protein